MTADQSRDGLLAIFAPRVIGATDNVISNNPPPPGVPVQGIPLHLFQMVTRANGVLARAVSLSLDPPVDDYESIAWWLNGQLIENRAIPPDDRDKPTVFNVFESDLLDNTTNIVFYKVHRGSGNEAESTPLWVLYSRELPGGNEVPGTGDHPDLVISLPPELGNPPSIGKEEVDNGVRLSLSYPFGKAYDVLTLEMNRERFTFTVQPGQELKPFVITITRAMFERAGGTNPAFSMRYTVVDQLTNATFQRRWSRTILADVDVDTERGTLVAPDLSENPDDPADDPDTIDLAKLKEWLYVLVHVFAPRWAANDIVRISYTCTPPSGPVVTHSSESTVTRLPFTHRLQVPAAKVLPNSHVRVTYEQIRAGKVIGTSRPAEALVIGQAHPELNAPFLVAPAKNPIDPPLYPNGVTVRIEHLVATEDDEAQLELLNALPGTPPFSPLPINKNKRANFTLNAALLANHQARNLRLRWILISKGLRTPSPERRLTILPAVPILQFVNAPYTIAPAGRFTVELTQENNGAGVPGETVELTLPPGFAFSDNVGGSRHFVTDGSGKIKVDGVRGNTVSGAYTLTARHGNQVVSGVATIKPLATAKTISGIPSPYNIAISPDGTRVYITSLLGNGTGALTVIDTGNHAVVGFIEFVGGALNVAVSPDNSRVYVTRNGDRTNITSELNILAAASLNMMGRFVFDDRRALGIALSPDGTRAYVCGSAEPANSLLNGRLEVLDTALYEPIQTITLQNSAGEVAVSPDGNRVYASNAFGTSTSRTSGTISVIETQSYSVLRHIEVGPTPQGNAVSPDNSRVYTVTYDNGLLVVIDARTNTVIRNVPLGLKSWHLALSPNGRYLCASEWPSGDGAVLIDTSTFDIRSLAVGRTNAGVAFSADSTRVYLCNNSGNAVWVVDL